MANHKGISISPPDYEIIEKLRDRYNKSEKTDLSMPAIVMTAVRRMIADMEVKT